MAFSEKCGYSSLILHQNSASGCFLKVSGHVESENLVTLKSIHLSYT